jgi:hypothetical protein
MSTRSTSGDVRVIALLSIGVSAAAGVDGHA